MLQSCGYHILRVGIGITFVWIGVLIYLEPAAWGALLQPWAKQMVLMPLDRVMIATAFLDILVGLVLLAGRWVWLAAAVGSIHLAVVLITAGVTATTVRDVGVLAGTLTLACRTWPAWLMGHSGEATEEMPCG